MILSAATVMVIEAWSKRDLAEEKIRYLFLDGWYPKVRIGKKRVRVPVLVVLGTCADGRRVCEPEHAC